MAAKVDKEEYERRREAWRNAGVKILTKSKRCPLGSFLSSVLRELSIPNSGAEYFGLSKMQTILKLYGNVFEVCTVGSEKFVKMKESFAVGSNPVKLTKKQKLAKLEEEIMEVINTNGGEIVAKDLWRLYTGHFRKSPTTKEYGVLNMGDVLNGMDKIKNIKKDGKEYLSIVQSSGTKQHSELPPNHPHLSQAVSRGASHLRDQFSPSGDMKSWSRESSRSRGESPHWGQGAASTSSRSSVESPHMGREFVSSRYRGESPHWGHGASSTTIENRSRIELSQSVDHDSLNPSMRFGFGINYSDLKSQMSASGYQAALHPLSQPAFPLSNLSQPSSHLSNLSQPSSHLSNLSQPSSHLSNLSQPSSNLSQPSHLFNFPTNPPSTPPQDSLGSSGKEEDGQSSEKPEPVHVEKLERRTIDVDRIRLAPGMRLTADMIEQYAQECIDTIAEANHFVSLERIEKLLIQRLNINSLKEINIPKIERIKCVYEHNRKICKVNAYIHAFVKSHSFYSLHDLEERLREFVPEKKEFEHYKLGPLQTFEVVNSLFRFPSDVVIPKITTEDILEHIRDYMTKFQKWTEALQLEEVMEYIVEKRKAKDAYHLGIGIRSLPLAAQVLKKAQRDAAASRRSFCETYKTKTEDEIMEAFRKFKVTMLSPGKQGENEIREHYLKMKPLQVIKEIYQKFTKLISIDNPTTKAETRRQNMMKNSIDNFLSAVEKDPLAETLFHVSVCISDTILDEALMEVLHPREEDNDSSSEGDQPDESNSLPFELPSESILVSNLKEFLERVLQQRALTLQDLCQIENKMVKNFNATQFKDLDFGTFLHFLTTNSEAKKLLVDYGGNITGAPSSDSNHTSSYKPTYLDFLTFVRQCLDTGKKQEEQIEAAFCTQFDFGEARQAGYGNISSLISKASKPGPHSSSNHPITYECVLVDWRRCQKYSPKRMGSLGHQTRDTALLILHNCPLLTDMYHWSHWTTVFEPELGPLKNFVQKYGGQHTVKLEENKLVFTDILGLETKPGTLLKLSAQSTQQKIFQALDQSDALLTCGHFVSMIVLSKGVENTPIALIANQVKTTLFGLHSTTAPPTGPNDGCDPAVRFVLQCLCLLPKQILHETASTVFLEPLSSVLGATKSKTLLLKACQNDDQRNCLEELGCWCGIEEWTRNLLAKAKPRSGDVQIVGEQFAQDDFEDELMAEDEDEDEYLSVDDQESWSGKETGSKDTMNVGTVDEDADQRENSSPTTGEENVKNIKTDIDEVQGRSEEGDEDKVKGTEVKVEGVNDTEVKVEGVNDTEVKVDGIKVTSVEEVKVDEDGKVNVDDETHKVEDSIEEEEEEEEGGESNPKKAFIDLIRKEEFGVGVQLNKDTERLVRVQQERQGRSLDRLSKDLYSKDTHFVLELIQNADDNSYSEQVADSSRGPAVTFVVEERGITLYNNEVGFTEKEIKAICDVGSSTKGKHKYGYIGQKGIGFKSVFRITDKPEIHSNGYHFCFDVNSGPMGYIMPHWLDVEEEDTETWMTKIVLPFKPDMLPQSRSLAAKFNDIHPSLLLFLHRLKEITIENKFEETLKIQRKDYDNIVEIRHGDSTDRWLVVKKRLDCSSLSLQTKSGVEVESSEIALAFPLRPSKQAHNFQTLPDKQLVFAYLPLRSYGFRFIIQGDFDVPSSRECVDRDSAWNQWLRDEIHNVFIDALDTFKNHQDLSDTDALLTFLQFVPTEDEVLDFFKPVASQILGKLWAKQCLPVISEKGESSLYKIPSQTVIVRDPLVREVISPAMLHQYLNLYYLRDEVAAILSPSLAQNLGVERIGTEKLLDVGQALFQEFQSSQTDKQEQVKLIAKWLACVYRSLDQFSIDDSVFERIKSMKIIPIAGGDLVSLLDTVVFLPPLEKTSKPQQRNDALWRIEKDLRMVDGGLLRSEDEEINSQVKKMLQHINVKQLSPEDLIHHHILPVLRSEEHKSKESTILISYIVYIKEQSDRSASIVNFDELKAIAQVKTNHGFKNPSTDSIHFTPPYSNPLNLQKDLPGYDWTLLDSEYLNQSGSVQSWRDFFSKLGVVDFLDIRTEEVKIPPNSSNPTRWASQCELLPDSPSGYFFTDFTCEEFKSLVTKNKHPASFNRQMKIIYEKLDLDWDRTYKRFATIAIKDSEDKVLKNVDSTFATGLKDLNWVPADQWELEEVGQRVQLKKKEANLKPRDLYVNDPKFFEILGCDIEYLGCQHLPQSSFTRFLNIRSSLDLQVIREKIISWGKRDDENPKTHIGSLNQFRAIYQRLKENSSPKDLQDLFYEHPVIFVPKGRQLEETYTKGLMLARGEVWWDDPHGLFSYYQQSLREDHSDLANRHVLQTFYDQDNLRDLFVYNCQIAKCPSASDYANLLVVIARIHRPTEKDVTKNVMKIYSLLGSQLNSDPDAMDLAERLKRDVEKAQVMKDLEEQEIFMTEKNVWVSKKNKPMLADVKDYEKMFSELGSDSVHFIKSDLSSSKKSSGKRSESNYSDNLLRFMEMFPIAKLSEMVKMEDQTPNLKPSPKIQQLMHNVTPYIQQYIWNNYHDNVYKTLTEQKIGETLSKMQFFEVSKLDVIYRLNGIDDVNVTRPEKCICKKDSLIVDEAYVKSIHEVNKELAKFFSCGNKRLLKDLIGFLRTLTSLLNETDSSAKIQSYLQEEELEDLPEEEEKWAVPEPITVAPPPAPPLPLVMNMMDGEDKSRQDGEKVLRSWPPRAPEGHQRRSDSTPSKPLGPNLWPPPKQEGFVARQRTDTLPANIQVVHGNKERVDSHGDREQKPPNVDGAVVLRQNSEQTQSRPSSREKVEGQGLSRQTSLTGDSNPNRPVGTGQPRLQDGAQSSSLIAGKRKIDLSADDNESQEAKRRSSLPDVAMVTEGLDDQRESIPESDKREEIPVNRSRSQTPGETPQRRTFTFDNPQWQSSSTIIPYKELPVLNQPHLVPNPGQDSDEVEKAVGRWGERLVYDYLLQQKDSNPHIVDVTWVNKERESGEPYDFAITFRDVDGQTATLYSDVKSTYSDAKRMFEISLPEIKFAWEQSTNYEIYRLFNAGSSEKVKLVRISNVMDQNNIKFYMHI